MSVALKKHCLLYEITGVLFVMLKYVNFIHLLTSFGFTINLRWFEFAANCFNKSCNFFQKLYMVWFYCINSLRLKKLIRVRNQSKFPGIVMVRGRKTSPCVNYDISNYINTLKISIFSVVCSLLIDEFSVLSCWMQIKSRHFLLISHKQSTYMTEVCTTKRLLPGLSLTKSMLQGILQGITCKW